MEDLSRQRQHSLRYLPRYAATGQRQGYLDYPEGSSTLASFRLGNANLGNRENPKIINCPACLNGQNNELHLVFQCKAMEQVRVDMRQVFDEAVDQRRFRPDDPRKLQSFLGGDSPTLKVYRERATLLEKLKERHSEFKNAHEKSE